MDISEAVNVPTAAPQTETKEVKVYASVDSTNGRVWSMGTLEQMGIAVRPAPSNLIKIVELTGTYEAHVKPKSEGL